MRTIVKIPQKYRELCIMSNCVALTVTVVAAQLSSVATSYARSSRNLSLQENKRKKAMMKKIPHFLQSWNNK